MQSAGQRQTAVLQDAQQTTPSTGPLGFLGVPKEYAQRVSKAATGVSSAMLAQSSAPFR